MAEEFEYRQAKRSDLQDVASLFDLYRQFYDCESDQGAAEAWLNANFADQRSVILVAVDESEKLLGFTQLYPALCSVDLVRYFVLYDLYVAAPYRRRGVGRGLMAAAKNWALTAGAARVDLETANDNTGAQALYETLGYVRDEVFYKYSLDLK